MFGSLGEGHVLLHELFESFGDHIEKVVDELGVVSPNGAAKVALLLAHVEWR